MCKKPSKKTCSEASASSKSYLFIFLQMCLHARMHVYRCMGSCKKAPQPWEQGRASSLDSNFSKLMNNKLPPKGPSVHGSVVGVGGLCIDLCPGSMRGEKGYSWRNPAPRQDLDTSWNLSVTRFPRQYELLTLQPRSFWPCAGSCPSTISSPFLAWTIRDSPPVCSLN